jgi:molecular chaperone GrpE (heat shock protein)
MNATEDFASEMQKLAAEAATALPPEHGASDGNLGAVLEELRTLNSRMQRVESALARSGDYSASFDRIDQQLSSIRETESVNQKLFDSLHDELIRYRDNFLHESLQKPFIRDLLLLFDDLSGIATQAGKEGGALGQNIDNAMHSLIEILHRLEVTEIEAKERVDRTLHRVVSYEPADFAEEDGLIIMRLKRGFFWRNKVLRPEEVVAKRFQ